MLDKTLYKFHNGNGFFYVFVDSGGGNHRAAKILTDVSSLKDMEVVRRMA